MTGRGPGSDIAPDSFDFSFISAAFGLSQKLSLEIMFTLHVKF